MWRWIPTCSFLHPIHPPNCSHPHSFGVTFKATSAVFYRCNSFSWQDCGRFIKTLNHVQYTKTCCTVLSIPRQKLKNDFCELHQMINLQYAAVTQLSFLPRCTHTIWTKKKKHLQFDKPKKKHFLNDFNGRFLIVDTTSSCVSYWLHLALDLMCHCFGLSGAQSHLCQQCCCMQLPLCIIAPPFRNPTGQTCCSICFTRCAPPLHCGYLTLSPSYQSQALALRMSQQPPASLPNRESLQGETGAPWGLA